MVTQTGKWRGWIYLLSCTLWIWFPILILIHQKARQKKDTTILFSWITKDTGQATQLWKKRLRCLESLGPRLAFPDGRLESSAIGDSGGDSSSVHQKCRGGGGVGRTWGCAWPNPGCGGSCPPAVAQRGLGRRFSRGLTWPA